jgi:hypothetical protein
MMLAFISSAVAVGLLMVAVSALLFGYAGPACVMGANVLYLVVLAVRGDLHDQRHCTACGAEITKGTPRVLREDGASVHLICPRDMP